jgi:PKD repeat protein
MKIYQKLKIIGALFGMTLMCSVCMADPDIIVQTNSWTNSFPAGTNTTYFTNGTMVGTEWWWGSWPQCSLPMTNQPGMDPADSSSEGSLYLSIPFTGSGQQGWFFSTFQDKSAWGDGGVQIPLQDIKQLAFDIYVKSGTPKDEFGNLGRIEMNLLMGTTTGGFWANPIPATFTELTIPASADGAWVHMEDSNTISDIDQDITLGYTNACAVGFYFDNYANGGYPSNGTTYTFWIANMAVTTGTNSLPPVSQFRMSTNIGVAPFTVTFQDTSLHTPTSWLWNFGDGGTSTLQYPSHTFTNMWRQTVTLKSSNAFGSSSSTQAVYQCFPCDAVYDWNAGVEGHVANVTTLSNSLVEGGNTIGYFTTTNNDLPSTNLQGMIFTNLPGMTNGCPVVFSNGVIYSNFNTTNALAYTYTNDHEYFMFNFTQGAVAITNVVWIFYHSLPYSSATYSAGIDEAYIIPKIGSLGLSGLNFQRNLGESGPLPGLTNDFQSLECIHPTTYGHCPPDFPTNSWFNGQDIYAYPNKLYRVVLQESTNGNCLVAIGDPATSELMGMVTNVDQPEFTNGTYFVQLQDGHYSGEIFVTNETSILANHDILSINRPLSWYQATNVAMFGP